MLNKLLKQTDQVKASDLFLSVGLPPTIKLHGHLESLTQTDLNSEDVYALCEEAMGKARFAAFKLNKEANYALSSEDAGRFRISAFMQKEQPAMVIRRIESKIPSFEELYLPDQLKEICMAQRGLILFVGATGAGKSTTQAAMVGYRNQNSSGHILTIEDPIEFVHQHGRSVVTQREVGIDTESFDHALKNSLRQAPDVILIGEIRNQETMEFTLTFAETGHLCMATLHANNANQALDRVLHLVSKERHRQFLFDLSVNLRAIVAQQLVPTLDGKGRRVAFEILYNTPTMADAIRKGELHLIKDIMKNSAERGMITFDQSLFNLYKRGIIGYSETLAHADSANDVRLMIKLHSKEGKNSLNKGALDGVTLGF
ncbi:PilT/PilU family type 4a pilus ATPase [Psychromonas antarctica]|uniref:PilT/PilU family type 4a pilus ATPase n=1 Tax=Psychromonas antarctica TaxID=67573 RepID=UPI001EE8FF21|nr:PilT/PilU family type 4a pilus ATPase [Psychromonas antarctica]MCG6200767.1 PilT/PilU family type 4a pilus ATPase [Psychromonas antarctica]